MSEQNNTKNSKLKKFGMLLLSLLILSIPLCFLFFIVSGREEYRDEAIENVSKSWAGEQLLKAPTFGIKSNLSDSKTYYTAILDDYNVNVNIITETRKKGIFKVPVYTATVNTKGTYILKSNKNTNIPVLLSINVSDSKGFLESPKFKIGNEDLHTVNDRIYTTTINTNTNKLPFEYNYTLRGVNSFYVEPKGNISNIKISGNWKNPEFNGDFLPSKREVNNKSFTAEWNIPKIAITNKNEDFPERIKAGVSLLTPVDNYRMALRALKYAFLFLILTFIAYFTFEITSKKTTRIHPIQYMMIGTAMLIFYLLLTSISEFVNFSLAYSFSTLLTVCLIGTYTHFVLTKRENLKFSILITSLLISLYGLLYTLLVLQDLSLILGSLILFITITIVMYATRNVEWYE